MKDQVTISMLTYAQAKERPPRDVWRIVAAICIAVHPLLFHIGACLTWALAWIALGRRPRPMLDDPKNFGGLVHVVGYATALSLVFWFVTAFLAVVLMVALFRRYRDVARLSAAMGCSYVTTFALLCWDPGGVVCWFMD